MTESTRSGGTICSSRPTTISIASCPRRLPRVRRTSAAFESARQALGDRGLVEIEVPDPLCLVVENMSYEDFMVRTIFLPEKIDALLDRAAELIHTWLEGLLRAGFGPVFRIFGPEYAAPPVMSLKHFRKYVTAYDRPLDRADPPVRRLRALSLPRADSPDPGRIPVAGGRHDRSVRGASQR